MSDIYKCYVTALRKECHGCICAHCLIAESNGGAPGCGNCVECCGMFPVHDCSDFYAQLRLLKYADDDSDTLSALKEEDNDDSKKES